MRELNKVEAMYYDEITIRNLTAEYLAFVVVPGVVCVCVGNYPMSPDSSIVATIRKFR